MYDHQCQDCGTCFDRGHSHQCCRTTYEKSHWNQRREPFTFRADVGHTEGSLLETGFILMQADGDNW